MVFIVPCAVMKQQERRQICPRKVGSDVLTGVGDWYCPDGLFKSARSIKLSDGEIRIWVARCVLQVGSRVHLTVTITSREPPCMRSDRGAISSASRYMPQTLVFICWRL